MSRKKQIQKKYTDYVKRMQKRADIEHSIAVLSWDKEVNLPDKGARFRARQVATLSGIAHEMFTDKSFGKLIKDLSKERKKLTSGQSKNILLTQKEYRRSKKLSEDFVVKKSKAVSEAYHAWIAARKENKFKLFRKPLSKVIDICRKEADLMGYKDHPYDALLDIYEPDAKTKDLSILFGDVRKELVKFVKELRGSSEQIEDDFLKFKYDHGKQWNFGLDLLRDMGYDFKAGRQDISSHPFTINFSPEDVRVTTRIDENDFRNMTWSCIHEGGHALYEQGLPVEQYGLPLGSFISLGIHESQSRLWENNVGRSKAYWKANYGKLKKIFPKNLKSVSLEKFYRAINKIEPNLIRTEADELHYHFHVLIRFEIEKELMEGKIKIRDLKEIWNAKYKAYLGVEAKDDKTGILQDIHWSHGSIGYFPTYSLGSFYAAQFFHQAKKEIPNLLKEIEKGNNQLLLLWLREKIHRHGRMYNAAELCERITGEKLNFKYFMNYARRKFGEIYGL